TREVTWFAAIMFAVFGFGLLLGLLSGDPRFLLLKDSFSTAGAGLVHLVSLMTSRPLTLSAVQTWKPERAADLAARYRDDPRTRRVFRVSGLVWGVALIAEAVLRIPVIYLFPVDVAVGLSTLMMVVVCTGVLAWNIRYIARARKRHPGLLADSGLGF
ncbi:MAG TPA: VC0807 family protein, partial [Umezawaea sp.]|nr:VC0807 family protein [Umezawaea sp.]